MEKFDAIAKTKANLNAEIYDIEDLVECCGIMFWSDHRTSRFLYAVISIYPIALENFLASDHKTKKYFTDMTDFYGRFLDSALFNNCYAALSPLTPYVVKNSTVQRRARIFARIMIDGDYKDAIQFMDGIDVNRGLYMEDSLLIDMLRDHVKRSERMRDNIEWLLAHGGCPTLCNNAAIFACLYCDYDLFCKSFVPRIDVNCVDRHGTSLLMAVAVKRNRINDALNLTCDLLCKGADPTYINNHDPSNPVTMAGHFFAKLNSYEMRASSIFRALCAAGLPVPRPPFDCSLRSYQNLRWISDSADSLLEQEDLFTGSEHEFKIMAYMRSKEKNSV